MPAALPEGEAAVVKSYTDLSALACIKLYLFKSAELLLKEDGSVQMIRRAEKPEDYFATFDFCDVLKDMKI